MKHPLLFLTGFALSLTFFSCQPEETATSPNKYVNDWISKTMKTYYYWEKKMPSKTDNTLSPGNYFESLLYRYDKVNAPDGDRFSWIQESYQDLLASLNGVEAHEIGFDYVLFMKQQDSDEVAGQITYVKKMTPAASLGLCRGMLFDRINGTKLTASNYNSLMSTSESQLTLGLLNETYDTNGVFNGFAEGENLVVATVPNYRENPVYLDSVYTIQGRKVGYLVYNFFAADAGTSDAAYDLKLNGVFGKFKSAGITDLVLDLRYNSGGSASSAALLASMIVPRLSESNVYTYYEYNDQLNDYYKKKYGADTFKSFFTASVKNGDKKLEAVNNVGDNLGGRLVVLTGPFTASASEQVINGLKPYMDRIVLIGDTTYGKNVASFSLYEENDTRNKWGMQPIVAKYFNKNGSSDFTAGFAPEFKVDDMGMLGIKPLGDLDENLLNKAMVTLGIFNSPDLVQKRSRMMQNSKLLKVSSRPIRGLQLNKMPLF
jgi:C-terminal processing protease CtpA/Prc